MTDAHNVAGASIVLRPLTATDLDRVSRLEPELFGLGAWSREAYEEEIDSPGRLYLAAVSPDGELVGYAGVALAAESEVMTIGVTTPWRRLGIGRRLLDALLAAAREARSRRVFLEVRASDVGAQRLYERAGFRPVGRRRRYYRPDNEDAVVMRLDLGRGVGQPVGAEA